MSDEDFDTLLKKVKNWNKLFFLISVPVPVLSSFSSGYGWHVHFCVCPALNLSHGIFPLFCVLFVLHSSVDAGYFFFWKSFGGSFTWHILQKFANELSLYIECVSHLPALTPNPWLSTHLASSADEMRMVLCDSPVNTDIIFSYTLRAQIFEDCVSVR